MDIHKPKPVHGWSELLNEIGVIVVSVLIALAAEQTVEWLHWQHKVEAARETLRGDVLTLLSQAEEARQLGTCAEPWISAVEGAIQRHDASGLQRLYDAPPPFRPRNWRSTAWQTIMSTQVADHLDKEELQRNAFVFSSIEDMRLMQPVIVDSIAVVLSGRLGGQQSDVTVQQQLATAERLSSQLQLFSTIAQTIEHYSEKPKTLSPEMKRMSAASLASCNNAVHAVSHLSSSIPRGR